LGIAQDVFDEEAGDINGDGKIDISDYIGVANIIHTGSPHGTAGGQTNSRQNL
jgi:hypothetical protein